MKRYETTDMTPKYVAYFGVALTLLVVSVFVAVWLMFDIFLAREVRRDVVPTLVEIEPAIPPEPRLRTRPDEDYREFFTRQTEVLERYEWIDREAGVARIPIERAMEILAERGSP